MAQVRVPLAPTCVRAIFDQYYRRSVSLQHIRVGSRRVRELFKVCFEVLYSLRDLLYIYKMLRFSVDFSSLRSKKGNGAHGSEERLCASSYTVRVPYCESGLPAFCSSNGFFYIFSSFPPLFFYYSKPTLAFSRYVFLSSCETLQLFPPTLFHLVANCRVRVLGLCRSKAARQC